MDPNAPAPGAVDAGGLPGTQEVMDVLWEETRRRPQILAGVKGNLAEVLLWLMQRFIWLSAGLLAHLCW